MYCFLLQGLNKIGANVFFFYESTHLCLWFSVQQLICVQCDGLDRTRLHWAKQPPSPALPSFLSTLPGSIYLPLSHRLCGSTACCLVTGWSELDIIMTAMLIRPDPVFHLCQRQTVVGCLRSGQAFQMKSTSSDQTKNKKIIHSDYI